MDAEKVIEKILSDANIEAEKIKQASEEKEAAEQARLDEQLKEYKAQTEILARKAAEEEKAHLLATARMDIAKQFLAEKIRIIDEVFAQAQRQLQDLPDEDYRKLMTKLMLQAVETGNEEVIIDNNETRIDQDFINKINKQLGPDDKGNLKLSGQRRNIGAGFILRDGKINNNASLSTLSAQLRTQLEIELAKELFSN